ncbi:MAG: outer membrane lipid asymmetry maintenance protein MlaD [Paracoccaceae bacterium]|nr:outer membrane lipid asymmetry maintenance protein MlaD [Paracoccaceae bacterium]
MSENATEVLTGAGVLAVALGFLIYAGQGVGLTGGADNYELTASFRSVEGITVGTDVRLAGVKVGTVTSLALNPVSFFADATVTVKKGIAIPEDSTILVTSEGLLGGSFVEILPGGSPSDLEPGSEIEDTQGAVSLIALLMKFVGAAAGNGDAESATQ